LNVLGLLGLIRKLSQQIIDLEPPAKAPAVQLRPASQIVRAVELGRSLVEAVPPREVHYRLIVYTHTYIHAYIHTYNSANKSMVIITVVQVYALHN
jgi:hypothetical protein